MGPKKDAKKANAEVKEGEDPLVLLQNYQKYCKYVSPSTALYVHELTNSWTLLSCRLVGLPINVAIVRTLNDEEKYPVKQLLVDDEFGQVGPGGTRALMTAVMGTGTGMKGGPYKLIDSLRIWRGNCGDDGVSAIVRQADTFCH